MSGFLDSLAPTIAAEYARYIDGDLLGKLIVKNLLVNRLGYSPAAVFTPIGRYGDARIKYSAPDVVAKDPGDGHVDTPQGRVTYEVKFARVNMGNRHSNQLAENWAFVNLLTSPGKAAKSYDLLVAVGLRTLGLEDQRYWEHAAQVHKELAEQGIVSRVEALPHEPDFLSLCSFFILPRSKVPTNYFRINLTAVDSSTYGKYRAWGHDEARCRGVWDHALWLLREA